MALKLSVLFKGDNKDLKQSAKESEQSLNKIKGTAQKTGAAIKNTFSPTNNGLTEASNKAQVDLEVVRTKARQTEPQVDDVFDPNVTPLHQKTKQSEASLKQLKGTAVSVAKAIGVAYSSYAAVGEILDVTKRFERFQAQLKTSTGNIENASAAFNVLKQFAADTGQDIDGLIIGFNKLVNLGLDPSKDALLAYANVAAATGKTTNDFIEAVADASVAEFERLKEFGIKAKNEGDTIEFRFRGVTTTVKNNSEEIQGYLKELGQNQFGTALSDQANTLEANINRLGLSWDEFVFAISESGLGDVIKDTINIATDALNEIADLIDSGQLQASMEAWAGQFNGAIDSVGEALDLLYIDLDKSSLLFQAFGAEFTGFVTKAIQEFPANVVAMTKILTVELATMVDIGKAYGESFAKVVGVELAKLVDKVGIYANELQDLLEFWDGDTFDFEAGIRKANSTAAALTQGLIESRDEQISASMKARDATIADALQVKDETLRIYEDQLKAANELRATYDAANDADGNTDLGQFNTGGGVTEQNVATGQENVDNYAKLAERYATEEEQLRNHYQNEIEIIAAAVEQKQITEQQGFDLMEQARQQYMLNTEEQTIGFMERLHEHIETTAADFDAVWGRTFDRFAQGIGDATATAIMEQKSLSDVARTLANSAIKELISGLVQLGVKYAAMKAIELATNTSTAAATTAVNVAAATASTAAWTPAATMASLASFGANAAPAMAGISSTVALSKSLALSGIAHDGLPRASASNEGTYLVRRDEMVLNPRQRENFDAMRKEYEDGGGKRQGNQYSFSPTITINADGAAPGMEEKIKSEVETALAEFDATLQEDFASNGNRAQLLSGRAA